MTHEVTEVNATLFLQLIFAVPGGSFGCVPEIGLQVLWQESLFFARTAGAAKMTSGPMQCHWRWYFIFSYSTVSARHSLAPRPEFLELMWAVVVPELIVWRSLGSVQALSLLRLPARSSAKHEIACRQNTLSYSWVISQLTYTAVFFFFFHLLAIGFTKKKDYDEVYCQ